MEPIADIPVLTHGLSRADVLGMWRVRWGVGRDSYTFPPGLYRLGEPGPEAPILVTGNYKFTVDMVRRDTAGLDAWLLVLDTRGINVWCAAGKGTFGTKELVRRILMSSLPLVAESQTLIVPQLGAPGIAAHEVRAQTGYRVAYGPVRASDTKAFVETGMKATSQMRAVTFTLPERLVLTPVEVLGTLRGWRALVPVVIAAVTLAATWMASGAPSIAAAATGLAFYVVGVLAGGLGTPALLPWLPGRMLAAKGAFLGALLGAVLAVALQDKGPAVGPIGLAAGTLAATALSSYVAMNFTGSTPYTSPSGVERELRRWLPLQGVLATAAIVGWLTALFTGW